MRVVIIFPYFQEPHTTKTLPDATFVAVRPEWENGPGQRVFLFVLPGQFLPSLPGNELRSCSPQSVIEYVEYATVSAKSETFSHVRLRGFPCMRGLATAMALKQNSSLRSFENSGLDCEGDDEVGVALAGALGENSSLRSFEIRCCAVGDEAGRHPRGGAGAELRAPKLRDRGRRARVCMNMSLVVMAVHSSRRSSGR